MRWMDAEFGDAHDAFAKAEVVEQLGLRRDEGEDALGKMGHLDGAVHLVGVGAGHDRQCFGFSAMYCAMRHLSPLNSRITRS
jgi:hypothetical protein